MINIQIDEVQMKKMLSEHFKENIKDVLQDSNLEYWVRSEIHKLLAKEVFDKVIKDVLTKDKTEKLLKQALEKKRGQLEDIRAVNSEYDEGLAKIGKDEKAK